MKPSTKNKIESILIVQISSLISISTEGTKSLCSGFVLLPWQSEWKDLQTSILILEKIVNLFDSVPIVKVILTVRLPKILRIS